MILCSASFKQKGFGIKRYIKAFNKDIFLVSDKKISKRKQHKLEKYIVSLNVRKLLNISHLDITSYGCCGEGDIISQLCDKLFTTKDRIFLNDINGYAVEVLKKHIKNFTSVTIYGNGIYKDIQEQLYHKNGVCIILSSNRINNAIDTDRILKTAKHTLYYSGEVSISYLDMLKYYGTEWEDTPKFISMFSECKNP